MGGCESINSTQNSSRLLQARLCTFGYPEKQGISCVVTELYVLQKGSSLWTSIVN